MGYTLEKYTLPSNGQLKDVPKEVTIRNMTTAEEKMLLGSNEDVFDQIIKKCVVEPEDFNIDRIPAMDKTFLFVKIREVSYGATYKFSYVCPECGRRSSATINLDDLEVDGLPDKFKEPFDTFTLPVSGDTISLVLPRNEDFKKNRGRIKRYNSKFPEAVGDEGLIFGMLNFISEINGEPVDAKLHDYVSALHAKDAAYIRHRINKLPDGLDDTVVVTCPKCDEEVEVQIPLGANFFHTDFDD